LPWRPRARPSATLHEIPACPMKSKLEKKTTTDRAVCQEDFVAENGGKNDSANQNDTRIIFTSYSCGVPACRLSGFSGRAIAGWPRIRE